MSPGFIWSAPARIPAPACRACCARRVSSTQWCRVRHSPEASLVSPADLAACRALLRNGSRSFLAASRLLPRGVRDDAVALYAFCRVADDAIDQAAGGRGAAAGCDAPTGCDAAGRGDAAAERDAAAALGWLRERLALAYAGRPMPIEADRALADLVSRRGIPMALPAALLEGFAWDAAGRRYEDLSQLIAYAVRVAGSVGAMMALLMNVRAPEVVARACDLGSPCSSPTLRAMLARTRVPAACICRCAGCERPVSIRMRGLPVRCSTTLWVV